MDLLQQANFNQFQGMPAGRMGQTGFINPFFSFGGLPTAPLANPNMQQLLMGMIQAFTQLAKAWPQFSGQQQHNQQHQQTPQIGNARPQQRQAPRETAPSYFQHPAPSPVIGVHKPLTPVGPPTTDVPKSEAPKTDAPKTDAPKATTPEVDTNIDFTKLNAQQRTQLSGLDDHDRAVLHLWGIQMTSGGKQDGGVTLNVEQTPEMFKPAEREAAAQFRAQDQAEYGGITGKSLDKAFFGVFEKITGEDISEKYGNAPANFADGPVNLENRVTGNNGLSAFENGVLRLWGHEPLFNGGKIDGSILSYTLDSPNALDFGLNKADVQGLLTADLTSDGVRNGDSLKSAFGGVLNKVYLGGGDVTRESVLSKAEQQANISRPVGTSFPPDGDPVRYAEFSKALGSDLSTFDQNLREIGDLAGVAPQRSNLDGRFENSLFMRVPSDPKENASYLQMQIKGGALEGNTVVRQSDAIEGTRLATVEDPTQWNAAVARAYTYQFAAEAKGRDSLTADGINQGVKDFEKLAPDARVFTQVASVFKGNLLDGPGSYDNAKLGDLLTRKAQASGDADLTRLAGTDLVGTADVQTIGAVTAALDSGKITLGDVMASGAIPPDQMDRYQRAIGYVTDGSFNQDLGKYDANPGPTGAIADAGNGANPHSDRLDELKGSPVVKGFYAMLDLDGDGAVRGPESAAAVSNMHDLVNLMLSGAQPGPNAPAAVRDFFNAHDFDKDGKYSVDDIRQSLKDLSPVLESIKLDQFADGANSDRPVSYGPPPGINLNGDISRCPVLGKMAR